MSEHDVNTLATMWCDQPGMVRTMFQVGVDYTIQEGDNLVNIAERFDIPWQRLAEGAIKKWAEDGSSPPNGFDSFAVKPCPDEN